MSPEALKQLEEYGIAPPSDSAESNRPVCCPHCASEDFQEISAFSSTPCKALFRCNTCREPFDYFKCHL